MSNYEWFLLIVVVILVPLVVAVCVTLWTIDQANKRKRANRADAQIGIKRKAALAPEEAAERRASRVAATAETGGSARGGEQPDHSEAEIPANELEESPSGERERDGAVPERDASASAN